MDLLAPVRAFDRFQQKHTSVAIPLAVVRKYSDDQAGNLAALVAYYAFFSMFPLLLVFVTVLGFVLSGDPSALNTVKSSVLGHFPVIGTTINANALKGDTLALAIGILASLWAGLAITQAATQAFDRVWAVPIKQRPSYLASRLRGLVLLLALGGLFLVASAASGLVSGGFGGELLLVAGIVISMLLNFCLFIVSFKLLCTADLTWRSLVPGAALTAVVWEVLQLLGGVYIDHIKRSDTVYGTFALVIGVLAWLYLGAKMTLYCAEINVVLERRLWPRSLFGAPSEPADRQTLTALAKVEERSDEQQVDVSFQTEPQPLRTGDRPPGGG
ncbi:MAG: YihY/virulence factor BrkB family protein [Solirubrobacteraceae bacterium]